MIKSPFTYLSIKVAIAKISLGGKSAASRGDNNNNCTTVDVVVSSRSPSPPIRPPPTLVRECTPRRREQTRARDLRHVKYTRDMTSDSDVLYNTRTHTHTQTLVPRFTILYITIYVVYDFVIVSLPWTRAPCQREKSENHSFKDSLTADEV